jgi:DNA-binding response OmpR family regulator
MQNEEYRHVSFDRVETDSAILFFADQSDEHESIDAQSPSPSPVADARPEPIAKILVIDDEEGVREVLRDQLENAGYEVHTAGSGDEGMALYDKSGATIVIVDLVMPGKEGIETIQELRLQSFQPRIVAISGGGRSQANAEGYLRFAKALGADICLKKPFDQAHLLNAVASLLNAP